MEIWSNLNGLLWIYELYHSIGVELNINLMNQKLPWLSTKYSTRISTSWLIWKISRIEIRMHGCHVLFNFISSICGEIAMITEIWLLFHMNCRCMSLQLIFSGENLITECAAKRFRWVKSFLKFFCGYSKLSIHT